MNLLRTIAALAAVAALTAGCDDGTGDIPPYEEPTHYPVTGSPSPTTSNDPLTDPPKDETAKQFIKRFFALGDRMQATGETAALLEVSDGQCDSCKNLARRVRKIYRGGGSITVTPSRVVGIQHAGGDQWKFALLPGKNSYILRPHGKKVKLTADRASYKAYLAKDSGKWSMLQLLGVQE
ncbi:MAG: hypothetical protein L0H31_05345 [Nocardioidaceae bacterium]|nr:hypothetical protein [Nocardioidaceae bacterium]